MATFVSTTLTKRTGSGNTVFTPAQITDGVGFLYAPASIAGLGAQLSMKQIRNAGGRRTTVQVRVPQLSTQEPSQVLYLPYGKIDLWIPDGTLQTDVNDIVGYLNALTASGLTSMNNLLVTGEAVI